MAPQIRVSLILITETEWAIIARFHDIGRLQGWLQAQLQLYLITVKGYALFCSLTIKILGMIVGEIFGIFRFFSLAICNQQHFSLHCFFILKVDLVKYHY